MIPLSKGYVSLLGSFLKKRLSLQDKAELAMKQAVREVVDNHRKSGRRLFTWKNGKTILMGGINEKVALCFNSCPIDE